MEEPLENAEEARRKARGLGYPILLKAAGGGGGKGMRIVQGEEELEPSFRAAQGEARSAFDDPRIYIEKYLLHPRHIEFQILADRYGNAIHLGERECSIQRRHQKLIEESPSVALDDGLREEMGQAAVAAAKAVDYVNAGTIEFMFVEAERKFYFLEMNTRLQVEHPVTELLTGTDLVKEQILISSGERLSLGQQDVRRRGWAIEFRIYAEDPFNSFLPSTGTVTYLQEPQGPGVRMDSGIYSGCEVSVYYDPLIAKLVVWGENREEALARGRRALQEYRILGLETTIPLHRMIADDQSFRRGSFDTGYLEKTSFQPRSEKRHELAAAIVASLLDRARRRQAGSRAPASSAAGVSPWKLAARKEGLRG
jgi:acetyl/propionyl-CoA carboxylase alpha subunit